MDIVKDLKKYVDDVKCKVQKESLGWESGETSLTKLSPEELTCIFGNCMLKWDSEELVRDRENAVTFDESEPLPRRFDWRNVNGKNYITPIKDQRNCGSCVAFATIASVESYLRIVFGCPSDKGALPALSEANAYYCHGGDCKGVTLSKILSNIQKSGVVPESNMSYFTIKSGTTIDCYKECSSKRGTSKCKINFNNPDQIATKLSSYNSISGYENMKRAIVKYGPIIAGYTSGLSIITYLGGVYKPLEEEEIFSDHAVCFIGYDDDRRCFIYKNSWGKGWGDHGFGELSYDAKIYSVAYIPNLFSKVYSIHGDLYNDAMMRDNFNDFGQSEVGGNLCGSPDIIPSEQPISDYLTVLKEAWYYDFGKNLVKGANYIYTRSRNLSPGKLDYGIYLYYCESSLLMYPRQWKENVIKTTTDKNYAAVRAGQYGEAAVTPEPFLWNPPAIEPNKHYCLIGRVETPGHPNPVPDIDQIDDFAKFISENPAYVWRNVSLVDSRVSDYSEILLYEQGSKAGSTYFFIEGDESAPVGAYCTLHYEDGGFEIDCQGNIPKGGEGIGTLVNMPAGFKGNLVFTYRSDKFKEKRDWKLMIRAIYVLEKEQETVWSDTYSGVRQLNMESVGPRKGVVVGEYVIEGKA